MTPSISLYSLCFTVLNMPLSIIKTDLTNTGRLLAMYMGAISWDFKFLLRMQYFLFVVVFVSVLCFSVYKERLLRDT